jgi:hypothetical protein
MDLEEKLVKIKLKLNKIEKKMIQQTYNEFLAKQDIEKDKLLGKMICTDLVHSFNQNEYEGLEIYLFELDVTFQHDANKIDVKLINRYGQNELHEINTIVRLNNKIIYQKKELSIYGKGWGDSDDDDDDDDNDNKPIFISQLKQNKIPNSFVKVFINDMLINHKVFADCCKYIYFKLID